MPSLNVHWNMRSGGTSWSSVYEFECHDCYTTWSDPPAKRRRAASSRLLRAVVASTVRDLRDLAASLERAAVAAETETETEIEEIAVSVYKR